MTESILQVAWVAFLLLVLPQVVALVVGRFGHHRGLWWPILAAVLVAPALYLWVATGLLAPAPDEVSPIVVDDPRTGVIAHAAVAFLVQIVPWFHER